MVTAGEVGDDDVEVSRTSQRGVYAGAFMAYLGDRVPQVYPNSLRVTEPSRFYVLGADCFAQIMNEWFPMPVHLLEGLFFGSQRTSEAIGQRERLLALGSLTAGLTHELNNPAAAAVRATASLRERVAGMRQQAQDDRRRQVRHGQARAAHRTAAARGRAGRQGAEARARWRPPTAEDEVTDWLEDHGCHDGWQLAPVFVQAGLYSRLARPGARHRGRGHARARAALAELHGRDRAADERDRGRDHPGLHPGRRGQAVLAAGPRAVPGGGRARPAVEHAADDVGQAQGHQDRQGLRQVAAEDPRLRRRAQPGLDQPDRQRRAGDGRARARSPSAPRATTATCSSRSATPAPAYRRTIQERIFEPFFTTKPVGEGTGLGLDIAWRIVVNKHHGDLRVESVPGDTRFQVRLPIQPEAGPRQNSENS